MYFCYFKAGVILFLSTHLMKRTKAIIPSLSLYDFLALSVALGSFAPTEIFKRGSRMRRFFSFLKAKLSA